MSSEPVIGFEPTMGISPTAYKTVAIDHYATQAYFVGLVGFEPTHQTDQFYRLAQLSNVDASPNALPFPS